MIKALALIALFGVASAQAGELPLETAAKPVIIHEAGMPYTVVWPSGNTAEIKVNRNTAIDLMVPFQVSENSCRDEVGQIFKMHFPISASRLALVWTKHSDPAKVGKMVTIKGSPLFDFVLIANGMSFRFPELTAGLEKDAFEPGDMGFIPGLEGPFRAFTIDIWLEEQMKRNPETGVVENRVIGSLSGVHVAANGKLESIEDGEEMGLGGDPFLLVGDVVTWIVNTPKGICQISSKPDLGPAQDQLRQYLFSLPENFEIYLWSSDGMTAIIGERGENTALRDKVVEHADE